MQDTAGDLRGLIRGEVEHRVSRVLWCLVASERETFTCTFQIFCPNSSAAVKLPLILGSPGPEIMDLDYLGARGVRICLQGHQPFLAAVNAVHETLRALRGGTPPGKLAGLPSDELMKRVTREADYISWTKDFLGG